MAQGLGDAQHAHLVGQMQDAAHVIAGGDALLLPEPLGELLGAAAQARELVGQDMAAQAVRAKLRLVVGQDVALVPRVAELVMDVGFLPVDVDHQLAHERSAPGFLADVTRPDRIAIGLPADAIIVADLSRLDERGVEALLGERTQALPLLIEPGRGLLMGGAVLAQRLAVAPLTGLAIEVL